MRERVKLCPNNDQIVQLPIEQFFFPRLQGSLFETTLRTHPVFIGFKYSSAFYKINILPLVSVNEADGNNFCMIIINISQLFIVIITRESSPPFKLIFTREQLFLNRQ